MGAHRNKLNAKAILVALTSLAGTGSSLLACNDTPLKPVYNTATYDHPPTWHHWFNYSNDVDILFVLDDTLDMADTQAQLAQQISILTDRLDAEDNLTNYRIAFTSSTMPHPATDHQISRGGELQFTSCMQRPDDFVNTNDDCETVFDARDTACAEVCQRDDALRTVKMLADDGTSVRRQWLEQQNHRPNLESGWTVNEALKCALPQQIHGSEISSPLESMYRTLQNTAVAGSTSHGFLRDDATLAIIIVTDDIDCSANENIAQKWFDSNTEMSARDACWKVSSLCTTNDETQEKSCVSGNYDHLGFPVAEGVAIENAVLYPPSKYTNFVQAIENEKKQRRYKSEVVVSLMLVSHNGVDEPVEPDDTDDPEQAQPELRSDTSSLEFGGFVTTCPGIENATVPSME